MRCRLPEVGSQAEAGRFPIHERQSRLGSQRAGGAAGPPASAGRSVLGSPDAWRTIQAPLVLSGCQQSVTAFGYRLALPPGLTRSPAFTLPPSGAHVQSPDPEANPEGKAVFFESGRPRATVRVRFGLVRDEQIGLGVFNWH